MSSILQGLIKDQLNHEVNFLVERKLFLAPVSHVFLAPKVSQEGREGASGPQSNAALKRRGKSSLTSVPTHGVRVRNSLMERQESQKLGKKAVEIQPR